MPDGNNPPNQLSLETQRTNLLLQDTLANLDYTLGKMQQNTERLNLGVKLDEMLERLAAMNMSTKQAMNQYSQTAQNLYAGFQQSATVQEMSSQQQKQMLSQQLNEINMRLTTYSPDYRPPANIMTMPQDFAETFNLHTENKRFMYDMGMAGVARAAGYYQHPTIAQPYYAEGVAPGDTISAEQAWYREMTRVAEKGSAQDVRRLLEHERNIMEETQKAALNSRISDALGVSSGMIARSEFEGLALPGLSSFAADYNMALDQAASVVHKLRQLHAVTADIHTGSGAELLTALDQTNEIFRKLSDVLKTTDVNEIISYAGQLTRIGEGSFNAGYRAVRDNTHEILGKFYDPSTTMAEAATAAQTYAGIFGPDSLAAMNAGAWDARVRGMLYRYGTGEHYTTGNLATAASIYSQALATRGAGTSGLLLNAGEGYDLLGGAGSLIDKSMEQGAVNFYLDLPKRMRAAQARVTGPLADISFERQVEKYISDYGFSRDEALLAMMRGNADAVSAYKEVQAAERKMADEMKDVFNTGMFAGRTQPAQRSALPFIIADQRYTEADIDLSDTIWNRSGLSLAITDVGRLKRGLQVNPDFLGRSERYLWDDLPEMKTHNYDSGTSYEADRMLDHQSAAGIVGIIANTGDAADEALKVIDKIANRGYKPKIEDLQRILLKGAYQYINEGLMGSHEEEVRSYIARLTPDQARTEIYPELDYENPVAKIILALTTDGSISSVHLTDEQIMKQQVMGSLATAGVDITKFTPGSQALRDIAQWANDNDNILQAISISTGIAGMALGATGVGAPVGAVLGVVSGVTGFAGLATEGIDKAMSYMEVMAGSAIDFEAVSQTLGLADTSVTALSSEIRNLILWLRVLVASFGMDFSTATKLGRLHDMLKEVLINYSALVRDADHRDSSRSKKNNVSEPLSDEDCNSLINKLARSQYASLSRSDKLHSGMTFETVRKVYATVVYGINDEHSAVGTILRSGSPASRLDQDIVQALKDISGDVAEWTWEGSTLSSYRTILQNADAKELSQFIVQTSAMKDRTLEYGKMVEDIKLAIAGNPDATSKEKGLAQEAIGKLTDAITKADAGIDLSGDEANAIDVAFGSQKGKKLREIMNLQDGSLKIQKLSAWMQDAAQEAGETVSGSMEEAQHLMQVFIQMANMIKGDPGAQQLSRDLYKMVTSS